MFLGRALYSLNVCLHSGVLRGSWEFLRKPEEMLGGILVLTWLNYRFYLTIMWCMHNDSMKG